LGGVSPLQHLSMPLMQADRYDLPATTGKERIDRTLDITHDSIVDETEKPKILMEG
jgi:hypothetical protein